MAYVSLYRKWRPQTFSDIVGQDNVVKTLKNAIKLDRIAHAYLFCGPRGTGKTSTAKILAKALNCEDGPTVDICGECSACNKITNNNSIDVLEIDAASNRGINEIRELREKVKFSPTEGNYKVYIIDEVHMLTTEAFNALLKTLEEPPEYVIFILATTEPNKLLSTILSRCQRFDFGRLSINDIIERLSYISEQEEVEISHKAMSAIARNAGGGMRDAISILDQTISYAGSEITIDDVSAVLGMVDRDILIGLTKIMIDHDVEEALNLVSDIIGQGKNISQFVDDLIHHFRNLLLLKECTDTNKLIEVGADEKEELKSLVGDLLVGQILRWIEILNEMSYDLKQTTQQRLILEMGIIKLVKSETDKSMDTILNRLTKLEEQVANGQIVSQQQDQAKDEEKNKKQQQVQQSSKSTSQQAKQANSTTPKQNDEKSQNHTEHEHKDSKVADLDAPEDVEIDQIKSQWNEFLDYLKKQDMKLAAFLRDAKPFKIENNKLLLAFKHEFHKNQIENKKQVVEKALKKLLGVSLRIECIVADNNKQQEKSEEEKVRDHPLVKEALELFSGQVVKVEKLDQK
ncbi:DNA polymerase III subunit gamma/tau [Halanaerobacter jeridensis]|uniref:DNA-directed DNA polymerase n=1 Tax=Halanaerobacter jeridensis TaxID=706427 RepID=A0A939BPM6_9FIRM|nr:DNA polymerase III subunit gamma/tau [Halanaerobacter jeridensis]MBM7557257.1 DNA polymerase-3 subunit gamma/tau [Halanaerobacter jeridensis]